MEKEKLTLIRNFLFKTFLVGVLFAILLFVGTTYFWNTWSAMVLDKLHVDQNDLGRLVVNSFLYTRFYLIFVILVPAIGLHWLIKANK